MKRTDKTRKSDSHEETAVVNISTDETGEPGLEIQTCQEPVESNPQMAFLKSPKEYVAMAMKINREDKQLTSQESCRQLNFLSLSLLLTHSGLLYTRGLTYMSM